MVCQVGLYDVYVGDIVSGEFRVHGGLGACETDDGVDWVGTEGFEEFVL